MVGKFLRMLTSHDDPSLRLLSFRVDFNEHYRKINTEYRAALTPLVSLKGPLRTTTSRGGFPA